MNKNRSLQDLLEQNKNKYGENDLAPQSKDVAELTRDQNFVDHSLQFQ